MFRDTLKLYYKKDQDQIDLSLLVSDNYVQTYYFSRQAFERLIDNCNKPGGFEQPGLFVFLKEKYLRWSFDSGMGMTHQIRIDKSKWQDLIDQYQSQKDSSRDSLVTCVVS